jgi:hypothetical protein
MYDFETRQQFITYRSLGRSLRSIAAMMHIHRNTARSWNAAYKAEIDAQSRNYQGLALAAAGAGRIERARLSAQIFTRITEKLLEQSASSAPMDNQLIGSYVKLCRLLDQIDKPSESEPLTTTDEPFCDLPPSFDVLAHVKRPEGLESEEKTEEVNKTPVPGNQEYSAPPPVESEPAASPAQTTAHGAAKEEIDDELQEAPVDEPPDEKAKLESEQFWELYRRKFNRY